jgi:hypothetical protein
MVDIDEYRDRKRYLVGYNLYGVNLVIDALLAEIDRAASSQCGTRVIPRIPAAWLRLQACGSSSSNRVTPRTGAPYASGGLAIVAVVLAVLVHDGTLWR